MLSLHFYRLRSNWIVDWAVSWLGCPVMLLHIMEIKGIDFVLNLHFALVHGNSHYGVKIGINLRKEAIIRQKTNKHKSTREMSETLGMGKWTIWFILKRKDWELSKYYQKLLPRMDRQRNKTICTTTNQPRSFWRRSKWIYFQVNYAFHLSKMNMRAKYPQTSSNWRLLQ